MPAQGEEKNTGDYVRQGCSQGCIFRLTCSHPELTEDHVLTSAYVKIFRTVTRNAVNKSVWRKKDCFLLPLNKHAMNIWLSSLRIRAHLSWRTGKRLHVLHVLRTYSTCSYPGYQDTTTYAALAKTHLQINQFPPQYVFMARSNLQLLETKHHKVYQCLNDQGIFHSIILRIEEERRGPPGKAWQKLPLHHFLYFLVLNKRF